MVYGRASATVSTAWLGGVVRRSYWWTGGGYCDTRIKGRKIGGCSKGLDYFLSLSLFPVPIIVIRPRMLFMSLLHTIGTLTAGSRPPPTPPCFVLPGSWDVTIAVGSCIPPLSRTLTGYYSWVPIIPYHSIPSRTIRTAFRSVLGSIDIGRHAEAAWGLYAVSRMSTV